jgi:uncharacterized protein (DUF2235 family)
VPKNIIICADAAGSKFCDKNTNVVRFYSCLDLSDPNQQVAYYHGGLGTMGAPGPRAQWSRHWAEIKGLAFGCGLTQAVGDCYSFLMETFESEDRIFLFGFSRGAYTVRALASMLQMLGLVRPKDYNLVGYATETLKSKRNSASLHVAAHFKRTFSRRCNPYFIGLWDSVSSIGWAWDPVPVQHTVNDLDLIIGRHAVSIDERRCFFRQNLWGAPRPGQDVKQVWFAGMHSDIGGGHPEAESGLAKIPLEWMLNEANDAGLNFDAGRVATVLGYAGGRYSSPDASAIMHDSRKDPWLLLEPFPHRYYGMNSDPPQATVRIPWRNRRLIPAGVIVHDSVNERMALGIGYRPLNLPSHWRVEPWVRCNTTAEAYSNAHP